MRSSSRQVRRKSARCGRNSHLKTRGHALGRTIFAAYNTTARASRRGERQFSAFNRSRNSSVLANRNLYSAALMVILLLGFVSPVTAAESQPTEAEKQEEIHLGHQLSPVSVVPFAALLLCIAVLPLVAGHWWEKNRNKGIVAFALGLPVAAYLVGMFGHDGAHELLHACASTSRSSFCWARCLSSAGAFMCKVRCRAHRW